VKICILGAGPVSRSIIKSCLSLDGVHIILVDQEQDALIRSKKEMDRYYKDIRGIHRMLPIQYETKLPPSLIDTQFFFDCLEDNENKPEFYERLTVDMRNASVLFTTSRIYSVTYLSSKLRYPDRIVGLQFFLPFDEVDLVEVVKGMHTASDTLDLVRDFFQQLGKEFVLVKDIPGFLMNRMLLVLINEATHLLSEGIATPKEIDDGMKRGLGMNAGPLELADQIGLDNVVKMLQKIYEGYGNPKYLPSPLLSNMVHAGFCGASTAIGFYNYSAEILEFPILKEI
jgi:3-hydroxybutyryl-CoA dehydrogenase